MVSRLPYKPRDAAPAIQDLSTDSFCVGQSFAGECLVESHAYLRCGAVVTCRWVVDDVLDHDVCCLFPRNFSRHAVFDGALVVCKHARKKLLVSGAVGRPNNVTDAERAKLWLIAFAGCQEVVSGHPKCGVVRKRHTRPKHQSKYQSFHSQHTDLTPVFSQAGVAA